MEIKNRVKNKLLPPHIRDILSKVDELIDNNLSPSVVYFCPEKWRKLTAYFDSDIVYREVRIMPIEIKDGC